MTDMPDTTLTPDPSHVAEGHPVTDDAAGYYTPGTPLADTKAPGGPTNDPYNLLVDTFDTWWLTLIYLVAMAMLGAHLHHGTWSAMQTLGLTGTERARVRSKRLAFTVAVVVTVGFSLVPIFVLAGVIQK